VAGAFFRVSAAPRPTGPSPSSTAPAPRSGTTSHGATACHSLPARHAVGEPARRTGYQTAGGVAYDASHRDCRSEDDRPTL